MITGIDHIGIAVESLDEAVQFYESALGMACVGMEELPLQEVSVAFFKVGSTRLELVAPLGPGSPVAKFLARRGPGLHHIAYSTDDLDAQVESAEAAGCQLIDDAPTRGAEGGNVAFLHPKSAMGVLTELCQPISKKS